MYVQYSTVCTYKYICIPIMIDSRLKAPLTLTFKPEEDSLEEIDWQKKKNKKKKEKR